MDAGVVLHTRQRHDENRADDCDEKIGQAHADEWPQATAAHVAVSPLEERSIRSPANPRSQRAYDNHRVVDVCRTVHRRLSRFEVGGFSDLVSLTMQTADMQ